MNILHKHPLTKKYESLFRKFGVDTTMKLSHFLGQLEHESGLKPIEENLLYSAKRLLDVFPKYFRSISEAEKYARNPEKIANRVYANRMGNGDEKSGDGYKYRGRGFIQLTGKNNYRELTIWAKANGINANYVDNPDLLLREADALISALWFWKINKIDLYAIKDDVMAVSRIINVGNPHSKVIPHGIRERNTSVGKFKRIFS